MSAERESWCKANLTLRNSVLSKFGSMLLVIISDPRFCTLISTRDLLGLTKSLIASEVKLRAITSRMITERNLHDLSDLIF